MVNGVNVKSVPRPLSSGAGIIPLPALPDKPVSSGRSPQKTADGTRWNRCMRRGWQWMWTTARWRTGRTSGCVPTTTQMRSSLAL